MKKIFYLLAFVLLIFSCGTEKGKDIDAHSYPKPKINEEQMISLLIDLHLVDAYLSLNKEEFLETCKEKFKLEKNDAYISLYGSIFEKYKITQKDFYKALQYYSFNQKDLLTIYEKVIYKLNMKKDSVQFKIEMFDEK